MHEFPQRINPFSAHERRYLVRSATLNGESCPPSHRKPYRPSRAYGYLFDFTNVKGHAEFDAASGEALAQEIVFVQTAGVEACLLLGDDMPKTKVMVALRDRVSVEGLTTLACQLAAVSGAELIALHVVQVPLATPLEATDKIIDQEGREILAHAKRIAGGKVSAGFSTRLVRARNTGEAIVGEARDQRVDLLVIGHHRQHEVREFLLGSTARHVAHHAPSRVIIQIPAPKLRTRPA